MMDLYQYGQKLQKNYLIEDEGFLLKLSAYLEDNNWFAVIPKQADGKICLTDEDCEKLNDKLEDFCLYYERSIEEKLDYLNKKIMAELPKTGRLFDKYCREADVEPQVQYYIADFILFYLPGELPEADDAEMERNMQDAFEHLSKGLADVFADFINWTGHNHETAYHNVYIMNQYSSRAVVNQAYSPLKYLELLYYLYNADYIEENAMYTEAAKSKNYVDTWLFLALHFICTLRDTDLLKLRHPILPIPAESVLEQVIAGSFSDEDAKMTFYSLTWYYNVIFQKPNKTKGVSGVGSIHFDVPVSAEVHIGTLLAIAEAHYQINNINNDQEGPLVRRITTYEQITRYMGEEIGELFLEANFHSIAANKAYMQTIESLTDSVLEGEKEFNVKGYILAALARSHKGGYGEFARTTSIYLKDAKMSGHSPEFVARELFERGVLSFVSSMLLKIITESNFDDLSVENQTQLIGELRLSPGEIDSMVGLSVATQKSSAAIVRQLYENKSREELIQILHNIGNGQAVAKQPGCECILVAMSRECPFRSRTACIGCEYELGTKAVFFLLINEYKRLRKLYQNSESSLIKEKYKHLVGTSVLPAIAEMLEVARDEYGPECVSDLESIIKEVLK